jgi:hypothetical protein
MIVSGSHSIYEVSKLDTALGNTASNSEEKQPCL